MCGNVKNLILCALEPLASSSLISVFSHFHVLSLGPACQLTPKTRIKDLPVGRRVTESLVCMPDADTNFALSFVRPEHLQLRVLMRSLVLWDHVRPTEEWVQAQLPHVLRVRWHLQDTIYRLYTDLQEANDTLLYFIDTKVCLRTTVHACQ